MFDYIDIHSHLYFPDFDADREEVLDQMMDQRIGTITVGTDFESSLAAVSLAERNAHVYACIGQHPGDVTATSVFDELLASDALVNHPHVVAIGECGLDYFRLPREETEETQKIKEKQKEIFQKHIDLSVSSGKPLMLHIRSRKGTQDAYEDNLTMVESQIATLKGNVHFFAGNMEVLQRFLALGFTVSFTGVLTFTHDYDELVRAVPLDRIMSETDAPFVAPVPHRGERSSPLYVPHVVSAIARIRGENEEVVKTALRDTALRFFNIR